MPTSEVCGFNSERGHPLSAQVDRPDGPILGAVLFAHCFTCSKDLRVERQISQALAAQGFAVLSFDFTGLGRSGGDFVEATFSSDVSDIRAAAAHLADTVAPATVLVGHSLGGAAVLSAAPDIPSVRAVATIGTPADPRHVLHAIEGDLDAIRRHGHASARIGGRTFTVGRSLLEDLPTADIKSRLRRFGGATLIMHAPRDQVVGIENAETLYRSARHPKSFVSLDNADHLLTDNKDAVYAATVIAAWASRYLPTTGRDGTMTRYQRDGACARNVGGLLTTLESRGYTLVADEPAGIGGTERGPSPYDYLAMALAACTAMTIRLYAERKNWVVGAIDVTVTHHRVHADDCRDCDHATGYIDRLDRTLRFPENLTEEQIAALERIASRCPVHRTLEGQIEVHTETQ